MNSENYFEFFDIAMSFQMDEQELKTKYYKLNRKYHPDFYTLESEDKQAEVLKLSSIVNQAYKTLADPMLRMKYILQFHGLAGENDKYELGQDFLMEMMETNEAIFDLQMEFDEQKYNEAIAEIDKYSDGLKSQVELSISAFENKSDMEGSLQKIEEYYFKSKYLLRIKENLSTFVRS